MSKFIVKPNKTLEEIIELNKKHPQNLIHEIPSNFNNFRVAQALYSHNKYIQ